MTIPASALLPQDMVDVLDTETGEVARMHASDARHAMSVEPDRYVLAAAYAGEPEPEPDEPGEEQTGADGPAWYPPEPGPSKGDDE